MKRLLSLFDYSGQWSQPYYESGWDVLTWDIKHDLGIETFEDVETTLDILEDIDGILAAPPCTDFSSSGAQYWNKKDEDGRTQAALELVYQVQRLADLFEPTDPDYYEEGFNFFWVVENPVGRLAKLIPELGKPKYFNPCDYAGYLNLNDSQHNDLDRIRRKDGIGVNQDEIQLILELNAYTKKTGLWGNFVMPEKKPIEPVKASRHGSPLMVLGGKSEKTKALRSNTPLGFANAFCQANN